MDLHPNTCISGPAVLKLGPVFHDAMERPRKKGLHSLIQKHFKHACAGLQKQIRQILALEEFHSLAGGEETVNRKM